ncbi:MAG: N-acetylmuramoyl-L-alanine amidase [Roseiflexus castenholzii]|nr:MAG: N-acetylmuramoyl-L-alanine amidase [Roseiflexus castenholzii]
MASLLRQRGVRLTSQDVTTGTPPMIGRCLTIPQWLDYVARYQFGQLTPSKVVLHHTWRPTVQQWRGLASMQGMQRYYANKGWASAPHIYVAPDGIWLFTPMKDIGIHAGPGNGSLKAGWYSIGVEMVGDYDRERPSGAVWEGTKAVLGGLSRRLNIPPATLLAFHRDYSKKSCPGWAVTKEWVLGEVNAWLNNAAPPPPPPPGPIGSIPPEIEELAEALLEQSYACRAEGYNSSWAFHQFAVENNLGFPMAKSQRLQHNGKTYNYQPFARDTLFCEVPNWGDVQRLSQLLAGSIPPPGTLGRALLDATYATGGSPFRPDWAFHQYAVASQTLGPPLEPSKKLVVDGVSYSYQVFATDTIFNRGTEWQNIQRLSALANTTNPVQAKVRDELLKATYAAAGQQYRPDWAFHQLARQWNLGAPLGKTDPITVGGKQYNFQVYATDTIYNIVPNWSDVKRLSAIFRPQQTLLAAPAPVARLLSPGAVFAPEWDAFHIQRFAVAGRAPSAYGSRSGSKIRLIVLHGDAGPALQSLETMAMPGSPRMPHYYVAADGAVYQLVDDEFAAFHSGMAYWDGARRNINRSSIGIMLERPHTGYTDASRRALFWLIAHLRAKYNIPASSVVRWSDLSPDAAGDLADLPGNWYREG